MQNHCLDAEVSRWLPGCYWHVEKLILECSGWFLCGCTGQSQQNSSPGVIPGHKMWLTFLIPCKYDQICKILQIRKGSLSIVNTVIMYKALVTQRYCYHTNSFLFFSMWPIFTLCKWKSITLTRNPASHAFLIKWLGFAHEKFTEQQKMLLHLKPIWSFVVVGQFYHPSRKPIRIF